MNRQTLRTSAAIIIGLWLMNSASMPLAQAGDYYVNNFEDKDDVSFWCCGDPEFWGSGEEAQKQKLMEVHFKGIVQGEKNASGVRSLKLDVSHQSKWNYWRGPKMRIKLDQPVYLSGYLYPEKIPLDAEVALGWSIVGTNRDGKVIQGNAPIEKMRKVDNGWIFFQMDLSEALRNSKYGPDAYLEHWYLHLRGSGSFKVYLDDIRISSIKMEINGMSVRQHMIISEILSADPYIVNHTSYFRDRPSPAHNVVDNSSFELGLKNWQVSGNSAGLEWHLDDREAFHGKRSLKIFRSDDGAAAVNIISQLLPVETGQTYTLSFYARGDESTTIKTSAGNAFFLSNAWRRCVVPLPNIGPWKIRPWSEGVRDFYSIELSQTGKGSVWLDAVQLEKGALTDYQMLASTELGIYIPKPGNIYHPGEPVVFAINIFNAATNTAPVEISYSIVDFRRKAIRQDRMKMSLSAGQGCSKQTEIRLPPGYYRILATLEGKSLSKKTAELPVGVIVPFDNALAGPDSFFGVNGFGDIDTQNFALQRQFFAKESGVKYSTIYNTLYWRQAPQNWRENNPQWEKADRVLSAFEQSGVVPVMALEGVPPWAGGEPGKPENLADEVLQGWHDYTYEVVRRYKDRVRHWELWPEYMRDPLPERAAMYIRFVKAASKAIRAADPKAVIIGFGEDTAHKWSLVPQLEAHFMLGSLDEVEAVGLDSYTYPLSPEAVEFGCMLEKLKQTIKKYNHGREKDIWITEVGWKGLDTLYCDLAYGEGKSYGSFVTELAQAEYIVRMNLISLAKGVKHFLTFNAGLGQINFGAPYSLMNYAASSPKTAFVAYNHMVNILANAKFDREIKMGGQILCYQFNKANSQIIAAWNYADDHKPVKIKGLFGMPKVKITNMVGTPVDFPEDGSLMLSGSPIYFEASGKASEKIGQVLAAVTIEQVAMRLEWKENNQLQVILQNKTSRPLHAQVFLDIPSGWQTVVTNQFCVLQPDEQQNVLFGFKKIRFDPDRDRLNVTATTADGPLAVDWSPFLCVYASKPPAVDGSFDEWRNGHPFKLGAVHRRGISDSSTWRGDEDLSSTVYAQWDEHGLYLGVEVNDNIFSSPHAEGRMIWANDALQIAFDTLNDGIGDQNYDNNDHEYTVSLAKGGKVNIWHIIGDKDAKPANDVCASVERAQGKIFYKMVFPWSSLTPMIPQRRRDLGFNLVVMDNDGDERRFPKGFGLHQYLQIAEGICAGKRPGRFKDLLLLEKRNNN
ncbi:MAG: sugar-binding protein [Verrucomicrobiae bacterium]|nr:sugar-binding protein [Verrucomicrobiae bacterium]